MYANVYTYSEIINKVIPIHVILADNCIFVISNHHIIIIIYNKYVL